MERKENEVSDESELGLRRIRDGLIRITQDEEGTPLYLRMMAEIGLEIMDEDFQEDEKMPDLSEIVKESRARGEPLFKRPSLSRRKKS